MQSHFNHVQLCATLWVLVHQAPLSMRFFQARILEWVATFSSRGSSWSRNWTWASYVPAVACGFFTTKWLSVSCSVVSDSLRPYRLYPSRLLCPWDFSRQEYWSGLSFPSPGNLPGPEIEPRSPALQADSLPSEPSGNPWTQGIPLISFIFKETTAHTWLKMK